MKGAEAIRGNGSLKELIKIHIRFRVKFLKWDGGVQMMGSLLRVIRKSSNP